ncbi:MAG: glycosyltransferase family 10, partial [Oculatellaceae cyanobacterium bins.114]|nr:glycosyltransferase family 10 [Oculatellaceae cyanobacterium bins.114]
MNQKIVGMISSYNDLNPSPRDWMWHQTPQPFGVWKDIQVVANAPEPDFILMYNFTQFPGRKSRNKNWFLNRFKGKMTAEQEEQKFQESLRNVPKERVIFALREPPFVEKEKRRIKDYRLAEKYCEYVSGPDDFAPISEPMSAIWYHPNSFRDLNEMGAPEKVSPCSWITSGIDRTANHQNRLSFIKLLRESGLEFDLYGRGLPDWAKGNGQLLSKWNAMAPYYYNLAIENFAENDWYVSEKLWDSLLAWCLPIYYGGSAADRLLPPGSFL